MTTLIDRGPGSRSRETPLGVIMEQAADRIGMVALLGLGIVAALALVMAPAAHG